MLGEMYSRSRRLLGQTGLERLMRAKVIVFGVGGVGSWATEGLVRSGVMDITIVDPDEVVESNINRQLPATTATVGEAKVDVMKRRLEEINPEARVVARRERYSEETADAFALGSYDVVIDAIDSLRDKALLITRACATDAFFVSSMGAALKMDVSKIRVDAFRRVKGCPLGHALRKRLRQEGRFPEKDFPCVFSEEVLENREEELENGKRVNGSLVHVTATFGFAIVGEVVKHFA